MPISSRPSDPAYQIQDPAEASPSVVTRLLRPFEGRYLTMAIVTVTGTLAVISLLIAYAGSSTPVEQELEYAAATARDIYLTVTERGMLESQNNQEVKCEVDDVPDDGQYGTPILWIIENGTLVKKGDLVCELDMTGHKERLDEQVLTTINAREQYTLRTIDLARREKWSESLEANAKLDAQLARLQLKQFEDESGGTYQLDLQDRELGIDRSTAQYLINAKNADGIEKLFKLGYKGSGDLIQARFDKLRTENSVQRAKSRRLKLVKNTYVRTSLKLGTDVKLADRKLKQIEIDNAAALRQNKIWQQMAELGKVWNEHRLDRYRAQVDKCKLVAPQEGMVAYHIEASRWGTQSTIGEGVYVRNGQVIMSIPDLKHMQVTTMVHESLIRKVKEGMRATVRIDAVAGAEYQGTVSAINVLPDQGKMIGADVKVFRTTVTIDSEVERLKPGMTAVVKIHLGQLNRVVTVPIQAIIQRRDRSFCYVSKNGRPVERLVEVGGMDDNFVEIRKGLSAGDRVVTNPEMVLDQQRTENHEIGPDKVRNDAFQL